MAKQTPFAFKAESTKSANVVRSEGDAVAAMLQKDLLDRAPRTRAAARLKQHGGLLDQLLWGIGP